MIMKDDICILENGVCYLLDKGRIRHQWWHHQMADIRAMWR